jgi:hypothetical protein
LRWLFAVSSQNPPSAAQNAKIVQNFYSFVMAGARRGFRQAHNPLRIIAKIDLQASWHANCLI